MPSLANQDPFAGYCRNFLLPILRECGVGPAQARAIVTDVLARAEAFAAMATSARDVLIAPFAEEAFSHEPSGAPTKIKAAVTVVVRNSLLEEAHANGPVEDDAIRAITTRAVSPAAQLFATVHRQAVPSAFAALEQVYPRAWSCLEALGDAFASGQQAVYSPPEGSMPEPPTPTPEVGSSSGKHVILSGVDPRFDEFLVEYMRGIAQHQGVFYVSELSRISRNFEKLFRVLEFLLAHSATILTSNYLLRNGEVWVRYGDPIKPDSENPLPALGTFTGLRGAHRTVAKEVFAKLSG